MAEEEKMIPIGETHETPQAITITIMDPSALGTPNIASSIVTSVEPQKTTGSSTSGNCNLLMVSSSGEQEPKSSILQTVTETHMGTEELPIISSISNPDHDESAELETKISQTLEGMEGEMAQEGPNEPVGQHCLICNIDIEPNEVEEDEEEQQQVPVFKSLTTSTNRRISIFLGGLVGQKLTSRKAHSDIMCRRCFNLLDRVDSLEVEIKETKEEIVNKYQETLTVHGGRARRKKPSTARKSEYVFPKVEPEDEDDQMLGLETDGTFEPRLEDLIEEEHDRREDVNPDDDEWEPEFKRTRIKREIDMDSGVPPKRKRGRPRKDATRPKDGSIHLALAVKEKEDLVEEDALLDSSLTQTHSSQPQQPTLTTQGQLEYLALLLNVDDFTCDCGVKSTSKMAHMEHIITHVIGAFKCPTCECSFSTSQCLAQHQRLVHTSDILKRRTPDLSRIALGVEGEMCHKCGMSVGCEFEVHAKTHLCGEFDCPICALRIETISIMVAHIERMHPHYLSAFLKNYESAREESSKNSSGSMVTCDVCGKVVAKASRLARHRYLHHPEHYPWPCPICTLTFSSSDSLDNHVCLQKLKRNKKRTTASQKRECEICGTVCRSKVSLKRHMIRSHPEEGGATLTCPVCTSSHTSQKALTDHLRHHSRQGYPCKVCGAKLKSVDSLNVHMNELHNHIVKRQCKFCPQVFFSSSRFSYHMKRHHTDSRSYTNLCHLCGKAYPYPSELRLHMRSHKNERPYKCNECPKTFLKKVDLTYHIRSHTGERPHECPHCHARFPRPNTLMSHIRSQHQDKDVPDNSTSSTVNQANVHATQPAEVLPLSSVSTSTSQYITTTGAMVMAMPSSTSYLAPANPPATLQPHPPAVTVMSVPGAPRPNHPTMVPVVEGQTLVDPGVAGQVREIQPVQYVQVEGLPTHTVQTLSSQPPQPQYTNTQAVPYQIVHFQILQ